MLHLPYELHSRVDDAAHLLGRVHSIETCGTVDGPGTRFVVFLQGCLFRCQYCHNRDTWDLNKGTLYSVTDILTEILPYIPFIDASNGGVTVSGGEPLLQKQFVRVLFKLLHQQGIHTCLDTNGYVAEPGHDLELDKLLDCTDLVLLDIKHINEQKHSRLTRVSNKYTLNLAEYLQRRGKPVWIRYVVVPGVTDAKEDVEQLAEFVARMKNVEKLELLPYHTLGAHKWTAYGDPYPLDGFAPPSLEKMEELKVVFEGYDIDVLV